MNVVQFEGQVRRDDVLLPRHNGLQRMQFCPKASTDLSVCDLGVKFHCTSVKAELYRRLRSSVVQRIAVIRIYIAAIGSRIIYDTG